MSIDFFMVFLALRSQPAPTACIDRWYTHTLTHPHIKHAHALPTPERRMHGSRSQKWIFREQKQNQQPLWHTHRNARTNTSFFSFAQHAQSGRIVTPLSLMGRFNTCTIARSFILLWIGIIERGKKKGETSPHHTIGSLFTHEKITLLLNMINFTTTIHSASLSFEFYFFFDRTLSFPSLFWFSLTQNTHRFEFFFARSRAKVREEMLAEIWEMGLFRYSLGSFVDPLVVKTPAKEKETNISNKYKQIV